MDSRPARWIDDRLGASPGLKQAMRKVFPDHWSFMLGEVALYSFVVLVVTGTFLTFFYDASSAETLYQGPYAPLHGQSMSAAYASVLHLSFEVRAGLVMRQTHHWAALVFIAAIVAHLCRVFFTGAFRRPREINWILGVTLLLLAIFNGFSGYSLPDDLLSGTGLRIAYSIALSVPLIGTWIAFLVFGGEFPSTQILGRLLALHIFIVPALIAVVLSAHVALIWHQTHTQFPERGRTETNVVGSRLWPTYTTKSIGLFFLLFAVLAGLGGLVQINPVWLYGPFHPTQVTSPAQPDWYLGWVEGALRLFPPWEIRAFGFEIPNPFFPAVLLPSLTFLLLYAWPFLEARLTKDRDPHNILDRPRDRPLRTAYGVATLTFYIVLFAAASNDLIGRWFEVSVEAVTATFQVLVLVAPPIAGCAAHRICGALAASDAPGLTHVPLDAFRVRRRTARKPAE